MYACKSQNTEFVAELVKHVTNINICDSDGKTVSTIFNNSFPTNFFVK